MSQPPDDAPRPPPLPGLGPPADPAPPPFGETPTRPEWELPADPDEVPSAGAELEAEPEGEAPAESTVKIANLPGTAAPPGPSALAARVAALRTRINLFAEAVYVRLRWHLRELVEDLRTRDRFFRWKAAIVAGWIALSFVSLGVARSGGSAAPAANRLQAYVVIRPTTMGWGLLVHNQSRKAWRAVEIRLDGYTYRAASVAAGEQLILGPFQFERDGQVLRSEHVPQAVEIAAEQGTMVLSLLDEDP